MVLVRLVAADTHTVASRAALREGRLVVRTKNQGIAARVGEVLRESRRLADVVPEMRVSVRP